MPPKRKSTDSKPPSKSEGGDDKKQDEAKIRVGEDTKPSAKSKASSANKSTKPVAGGSENVNSTGKGKRQADSEETAEASKETASKDQASDDPCKEDKAEPSKAANESAQTGSKRSLKSDTASSKKQKLNSDTGNGKAAFGSKHDPAEAPAPAGSASRLPKIGQRVSWKALPGWVHGEVTEIVKERKQVGGKFKKSVKASEKDPRIVLKADSGKICVHKPDVVYFDD